MRKKRARRRRMIMLLAAAIVVFAAGCTLIYWNLPGTKLDRTLDRAASCMVSLDYVQAQEAYEQALSIDETSERAYRGLADDFIAQGQEEKAEEALLRGYEVTGSEVLLQNYIATVLNDVVDQVNGGQADFSLLNRCLDMLELSPGDSDTLSLLSACADRVLVADGRSTVMLDGLDGSESFSSYESFVNRLLSFARTDPDSYRSVVEAYCVIQAPQVYLSLSHAKAYRSLLESAKELGVQGADDLLACLDQQEEVSAFFSPMFEEFEAENYEAAKEFIVSPGYTAIRDDFIREETEYWYGKSYIPVTKEAIVFFQTQDGTRFSFVEDDSMAAPTGTIRVLGQTMLDLGVQRSCIEYVPAYDPAHYYPHVEYEIVYWNTMVSGIATDNTNVVSRMNYRFAEKIYTAEGMEANMIYDWGGSNEERKTE